MRGGGNMKLVVYLVQALMLACEIVTELAKHETTL